MLDFETLYESDFIRAILYTASYDESVEMIDYNDCPSISFPIISAFKYKAGKFDSIIDTNAILLEAPDVESKIRKYPIYQKDITLSLEMKIEGFHLLDDLQRKGERVASVKRSPQIDLLLQSFLASLAFDVEKSHFAASELLDELSSITPSNHYRKEINHRQGITVDRAKEYIHAYWAEQITIHDIAHSCFVSPFHFSRIFKKKTGISPYDYLLKVRIGKACQLLAKDYPISDCAFLSGFNSLENFSFCFKKMTGYSPSAYKKSKISK